MYQEQQNFRQGWLWGLLALVMIITLLPALETNRYPGVWGVGGVSLLLAVMRLDTIINEEGIHYRWFPFMPSFTTLPWDQITSVKVRKYGPLREFGGWGIRLSLKGTVHTVRGHYGLEIHRKGKNRFILLGTQRPEEIAEAVTPFQRKGV